jgi:hypothetical protein
MEKNDALVGYVNLRQACARLGVTYPTMMRRIRLANVTRYCRPDDRRSVLLKVEDVDRLMEVRPPVPMELVPAPWRRAWTP